MILPVSALDCISSPPKFAQLIDTTHNISLIVHRLAKGDERALVELYDSYKDSVYEIAMRTTKSGVLSQEILQDVFTSVWLKREELPRKENFSAWLYRVARNRAFKVIRGIARRQVHETGMVCHIPEALNDRESDSDQKLETAELETWIKQALLKLTKEQRMAFYSRSSHKSCTSYIRRLRYTIIRQTNKTKLRPSSYGKEKRIALAWKKDQCVAKDKEILAGGTCSKSRYIC